MNLVLNQPCMKPFDPTSDLRVLIACEDPAAAERACAVLERLASNCQAEGRLIYQWWNFEVLGITALRALATQEAAAADLIIFAVRGHKHLPGVVDNWINRWLDLRNGRRGALVALLDVGRKPASDSDGIVSQLKKSAALGNLDFFAETIGGGEAREHESPLAVAMRKAPWQPASAAWA